MVKRLLGALGLREGRAESIAERVKFCGALAESFADRLPPHHRNNLAIIAAWWSVALYVQLAVRPGWRLAGGEWGRAAGRAADLIMDGLVPELPPSEPEHRAMRDAMAQQVLGMCRLWVSYFGAAPKPRRFQDPEGLREELLALFDHQTLDLRRALWLPDEAAPDETGEEEEGNDATDLEGLCGGFALFFDICSRSRP